MQIEQIDRDAAADYLEARGERALALRARNVGGTLAEAFARHRISALSARPASNYVMVREIETVTGDFCTEPGEPFYRIEIDGFCADFDYREAADNFAAAINARIAARPAVAEDVVERVARPDDDAIFPHLPQHIKGGKRCGVEKSEWLDGWFVSWSPRNDNQNAEGVWSDWVALANAILEADRAAIAAMGSDMGKGGEG